MENYTGKLSLAAIIALIVLKHVLFYTSEGVYAHVKYLGFAQIISTILFILYLVTLNVRSWWNILLIFTLIFPLRWSAFLGGFSFSMAPLLAYTAIYFIAAAVLIYLVVNFSKIARVTLLILGAFIVITIIKYVATGQGYTYMIRASDVCVLVICTLVISRRISPQTLQYVFILLGIFTLDRLFGVLIS